MTQRPRGSHLANAVADGGKVTVIVAGNPRVVECERGENDSRREFRVDVPQHSAISAAFARYNSLISDASNIGNVVMATQLDHPCGASLHHFLRMDAFQKLLRDRSLNSTSAFKKWVRTDFGVRDLPLSSYRNHLQNLFTAHLNGVSLPPSQMFVVPEGAISHVIVGIAREKKWKFPDINLDLNGTPYLVGKNVCNEDDSVTPVCLEPACPGIVAGALWLLQNDLVAQRGYTSADIELFMESADNVRATDICAGKRFFMKKLLASEWSDRVQVSTHMTGTVSKRQVES